MLKWWTRALVACVLLRPIPATADEPLELPEVVVTGERNQTSAEDAATAVTVVDSGEVEQRDQNKVSDAIRGTPGVDVTQFGSPGASTFVTIRGALGDEVSVRLDGVEVNNTT